MKKKKLFYGITKRIILYPTRKNRMITMKSMNYTQRTRLHGKISHRKENNPRKNNVRVSDKIQGRTYRVLTVTS